MWGPIPTQHPLVDHPLETHYDLVVMNSTKLLPRLPLVLGSLFGFFKELLVSVVEFFWIYITNWFLNSY
jgi:hypothetical protein